MGYLSLACISLFLSAFAWANDSSPALYARQDAPLKGDSTCGSMLCVAATVNGSTTSYVLTSKNAPRVGWMAIGFGSQMPNTPMVIMWMNNDGTATISQRQARAEVMPTVDSNPPRTATLATNLLVLSADNPTLAFNVPSNTDTKQRLIYALGTTNPGSSARDATLVQHLDYGLLQLDLTKSLSATSTGGGSSPTASPTGSPGTISIPLLPYQRVIVAHAVFCSLGFLLFLPAGALLARYMRTFVPGPVWFKGHWILQSLIAGPTIIIGIALGISSVNQAGALHLNDDHKRAGIALFVLYLAQCGLGAFIHFIKKKDRVRRPPQNYIHAVFGLLIIALALYQVHTGYDHEWESTTGRDPAPDGVGIFFWVWVVLLAVAYAAGLSLLPKQYRQESNGGMRSLPSDEDRNINLKERGYRS